MPSTWTREIAAVVRKEFLVETRSRAGLTASGLFGVVTTIALAVAAFNTPLAELSSLAAGMLFVAMLFAASISLPRAFLAEEESGTADLLRLNARPHALFWGKAIYNLLLMWATSAILALCFLLLTRLPVTQPIMLVVALAGSAAALTGAVTLTGAMVAKARNRSALAGAIALPLLLPVVFLGIEALRVPITSPRMEGGWTACFGLLGYAVASLSVGPYIYAAMWKS